MRRKIDGLALIYPELAGAAKYESGTELDIESATIRFYPNNNLNQFKPDQTLSFYHQKAAAWNELVLAILLTR